jgi:nucleotide-binding universal stress UspA family protein
MSEMPARNSVPTKILVPIDFSESSHVALEMATNLAQQLQAELFLVHIILSFPRSTFADFVPETKFLEKLRNGADKHLSSCQADLSAKGIKVGFCVEEGSDIAGKIVDVIDREKADLVVVSTHGITGWHPIAFGSIAEKLVKLVQCPLLLLRSARPEASL